MHLLQVRSSIFAVVVVMTVVVGTVVLVVVSRVVVVPVVVVASQFLGAAVVAPHLQQVQIPGE